MRRFDVIVVGAGGMGTAAAMHLARRGTRVIALDRLAPGHARGSSHGQTRLFRIAYYEHPDYVPLLRSAREAWLALEVESGERLFTPSGLAASGPPTGEVITGTLAAAKKHGLAIERLTARDARRRWQALAVPDDWETVFEADAGHLAVEACVRAHAAVAARHGAVIEPGHDVVGWRVDGSGVLVETAKESFAADRLVLCPGAWASDLARLPGVAFTVLRKSLFWFAPTDPVATAGLPAFAFDTPEGFFYGFPPLDTRGVKVAEHTGGRAVGDPWLVDRRIDPEEQARVERSIAAHLPAVGRERTAHEVCLYTMSPDGHFVVGLHPEHPRVTVAVGFSGHGFKFASVMGEVLADLAIDGATRHPIGFLSPARFAAGAPAA
jgi:sarcosine oxidase